MNQGWGPSVGLFIARPSFEIDLGLYSEEMGKRVGDRQDKRVFLKLAFLI